MNQPSSSQTSPALVFVMYTRQPPSESVSASLIRRGHSVIERGFSAMMHQLLHDLRPDLLVAYLDPADPADLDALSRITGVMRGALVLVLCPFGDDDAVIRALDLGADGCISSETSGQVVAAQADALLRRFREQHASVETSVVKVRDLTIDFARRRVSRGSKVLDLTRTEFDVLSMLVRNPGRVVSALQILAEVGQFARSETQARVIVKVHISHLRQKLEAGTGERYVETIRGVGYLLERREPTQPVPQEEPPEHRSSTG